MPYIEDALDNREGGEPRRTLAVREASIIGEYGTDDIEEMKKPTSGDGERSPSLYRRVSLRLN